VGIRWDSKIVRKTDRKVIMIRGKFVVTSRTEYENINYAKVILEARYDSQLPEDQRFAEATPTGKLEMTVTVPAVIEAFKPGKIFYLDFNEAPEGTSRYHS
jgi:hypothetical protein